MLAFGTLAIITAVSLWMRHAFPILAFADAGHDDLLFVKLAGTISAGHWLGDYDKLTMAKGAAYSVFIALNRPTGIPLKLAEHAVYLGAALYFSFTLGAILRARAATFVCFAVLAFNPILWVPGIGGRVVRENLYISASLLLLALAARVLLEGNAQQSLRDELVARRRMLVALGVTGGVFWLTREEGLWIVPSLAILFAYWFVATALREGRAGAATILKFVAIPLLSFYAVVGTVNLVNLAKYGVFRNNDFRSGDFAGAYGALSRISHDKWQRYVVFPKDARERAYLASSAARELQPFFEGHGGEFWRDVGCQQSGLARCEEIFSGWFMWALRDAVTMAGHYKSAPAARDYYVRLASEINDACNRKVIACGPARDTLVPPWRESYLGLSIMAAQSVLETLLTLGSLPPHVAPSAGSPDHLAFFKRITNGPLAMSPVHEGLRVRIAKSVADVENNVTPIAATVAILAWVCFLGFSVVRRRWHRGHVLVAAVVAAIASRVALLGFLDATSIPSDNILYLSPVVPLVLVLAPCVLFLGISIVRDGSTAAPAFRRDRR